MKDKIMSFHEMDIYSRNLQMLEARLGHEVPRYMLNSDDMCKEIMSLVEIDTMARNIQSMELMNYCKNQKRSWIDYYPIYILIIVFIGAFIVRVFNL